MSGGVRGFDPVAYHGGKPAAGVAEHSVDWGGAKWQFASAENKAKFEANPSAYAPQFGGYCAYGVSVGAKFDGDPRLFKVVGGKLYFNLNPEIQSIWLKDVPGNIRKADGQWKKIRDVSPLDL